jgi:hypothetical protein
MSLQSSWLLRPGLAAVATLLAGAVGAYAAPAPALADGVAPVTVEGQAPTSIAVSIVGKTRHEVLRDIRSTAHVVCRNAYLNGELGPGEAYGWCPDGTTIAAYTHYLAIVRSNPGMTVATLAITSNVARP